MKHILLAGLVCVSATFALAHSKINSTTPADGAAVANMPETVSMTFAKPIRLTRVDMTYMDRPTVQLELGSKLRSGTDHTVPVQDMGTGLYRIEWRGLGTDGHVMQGAFTFEVE